MYIQNSLCYNLRIMDEVNVFFSENQRFRQWWLWVILIGLTLFWAILIVINSELIFFVIPLVIDLGLIVFMYSIELVTEVTSGGLKIKLWPFHRSWIVFPFAEMEGVEEVKYRPIRDYGGWGIRYGIFDKLHAKAYTVSGNRGVMLSMKGGSKFLIGSKLSSDLHSCIKTNSIESS